MTETFNPGYSAAIEIVRAGLYDGAHLTYRHCRDLLDALEEGQNEVISVLELQEINDSTIRQLRRDVSTCNSTAIKMGKQIERLKAVEKLADLLLNEVVKWGTDIQELVEDYDMQDELDAVDNVGRWKDEQG